jgi:EmrB/QacA subfamily drug resistance transporter
MPVRRGWLLLAVILGSGVVFLDGSIVANALEVIGQELPSSVLGRLEGLTYVNSGYLAVLAALLILAGALGDTYGRRRIFRIGLIGFGAMSAACGLAPTLEWLVVFRLLQGAAGALLVPESLAIITATFSGKARATAIGTWAGATSAITLLGPIIGAVLIQSVSWRAAFFINVPLLLIALYALRYVPESRNEAASRRFDWLGAAVGAVAVGGLAVGATRGQESGWKDALAWTCLAVGAVALVLFPILMARRADPLVPPSLFRSRAFRTVNLSTFLIYGALYMNIIFIALFLQGTLGYSVLGSALATLAPGILLTVLSNPAGRLSGRVGPRPFLIAGPALMAVGILWLARIPPTSPPWVASLGDPASLVPPLEVVADVISGQVIYGLGLALLVAPLVTALMGSVPSRNAGLASAINNAISRVGAPLAGAALFVAVSATFYPALATLVPGLDVSDPAVRAAIQPLAPPPPDLPPNGAAAVTQASTDSFHLAMLTSATLLAIGAIVNGIGFRGAPRGEGLGSDGLGGEDLGVEDLVARP